jgi:hypothetical protein
MSVGLIEHRQGVLPSQCRPEIALSFGRLSQLSEGPTAAKVVLSLIWLGHNNVPQVESRGKPFPRPEVFIGLSVMPGVEAV